MKRLFATTLALVFLLCGCGQTVASSSEETTTTATAASMQEASDGYAVPSVWSETSINDGTWGYVTGAADYPTYCSMGVGCLTGMQLDSDTDQFLTLSRVPADQIPEKQVVTLAVPLGDQQQEWGATWTDSLDSYVVSAITQFNQASPDYRVEAVTYPSSEALNLMLLTGDAPDLIDWNYTAWLEDTPSTALYAKHGYLADLEPFIQQDADLAMEDFIPSIMNLAKERNGGLYATPLSFYFVTMTADKTYVGDRTSWTVSDMLDIAKTLPEDMGVFGYNTQSGMLQTRLENSIDQYVSEVAGTCDFENQGFYDMLTLCRDYFPAEIGEDYEVPEVLATGIGSAGSLGEFTLDALAAEETQNQTLIGYPDTHGSVTVVFYEEMSICALGDQTEGAWQFLRTLMGYDFQSCVRGFQSIRMDTFQNQLEQYLGSNDDLTQTDIQTTADLVYNATSLKHFDSAVIPIVLEEAAAFFNGDKTAEETARIIQNRTEIYLGEQS